MSTTTRVNPLDRGALTADDVNAGDQFYCWKPGASGSRRDFEAITRWYSDEDGTMVINLRDLATGEAIIVSTSEVGLTGDRHSGEWTYIARRLESD